MDLKNLRFLEGIGGASVSSEGAAAVAVGVEGGAASSLLASFGRFVAARDSDV